jgi:hypothetical protein
MLQEDFWTITEKVLLDTTAELMGSIWNPASQQKSYIASDSEYRLTGMAEMYDLIYLSGETLEKRLCHGRLLW